MGSIMLHQGGVLGLIALGFHWVMSTLRVVCVITGSLESGWVLQLECQWDPSLHNCGVPEIGTVLSCA